MEAGVGGAARSPAGRSFRKPQVRLHYCRVKRGRYSFVYVLAKIHILLS